MTHGIHHITAFCGDPQENYDFYAGTLGLRLTKVTVNFDDPGTYHTYYGDEYGKPGTALTFFPWPHMVQGHLGTGETGLIAFSIPQGSLEFWMTRLAAEKVDFEMGEGFIRFADPDGMRLELTEADNDPRPGWTDGRIPIDHAIRGFHRADLLVRDPEETAKILLGPMGFRHLDGNRYIADDGLPGQIIDLIQTEGDPEARQGRGSVHHIAFRVEDEDAQLELRSRLFHYKIAVTTVQERFYFKSIYYREPNGVLFEAATDGPGFDADEDVSVLGTSLMLPPWYEVYRQKIRQRLPEFRTLEGVKFP